MRRSLFLLVSFLRRILSGSRAADLLYVSAEDMALRAMGELIANILREYLDYFGPVGMSTASHDLQGKVVAFKTRRLAHFTEI